MCLHVRMNFFCSQFGSSFQKFLHNEFVDLFSPAFFQDGNPSDKPQVFPSLKSLHVVTGMVLAYTIT
jgi:hypothetical protein